MLYLLQLVSTLQGAIFKQAVINDKKLNDLNIDKYQNEIIFY